MTREQFQKFCLAQANWWCHAASNGHAATRHITRGDGHRLDADELRDDAMKTAQHHLTRYMEACEGMDA